MFISIHAFKNVSLHDFRDPHLRQIYIKIKKDYRNKCVEMLTLTYEKKSYITRLRKMDFWLNSQAFCPIVPWLVASYVDELVC